MFTDYKALVCVFLYGGNDSYNTVVPYDKATHARYLAARGATLAVPRSALAGTRLKPALAWPGEQAFALNPSLAAMKPVFDRGQLALAMRVGFSILLFVSILAAWKLGYIQPGGIPAGR